VATDRLRRQLSRECPARALDVALENECASDVGETFAGVNVDFVDPLTEEIASSSGKTTPVTTSSGVAPGNCTFTVDGGGISFREKVTARPRYEKTPSVTRKAISITVNTGYLTQVSAIFIDVYAESATKQNVCYLSDGVPASDFSSTVAPSCKSPEIATATTIPRLQSLGDLKATTALVFRLSGRPNLSLGYAIAAHQKYFCKNAIAIIHRPFWKKNCLSSLALGIEACHKKSGLQAPIEIDQQGFGFKCARVLRQPKGLIRDTFP